MYGLMWPFLFMFESQVERHSFVALRHSMATCIPRVDGLSTDPLGRDVTKYLNIHNICSYFIH